MEAPLADETSFLGTVLVENTDGTAPATGAAVTLNGVALQRDATPGVQPKFWKVDPAAQPQVASDGTITLVATAGTVTQRLVLTCPADVAVTTSTAARGSLAGAPFLQLDWSTDLDVNLTNPLLTDFYASAHLYPLDAARNVLAAGEASHDFVAKVARNAVIPIPPTSSGAWVAELRWQGPFVIGDSSGFCGRVKRFLFTS